MDGPTAAGLGELIFVHLLSQLCYVRYVIDRPQQPLGRFSLSPNLWKRKRRL